VPSCQYALLTVRFPVDNPAHSKACASMPRDSSSDQRDFSDTTPRERASLISDSPKPGKWPSALCGASMTLRYLRVMTNCRKVKRTQILKHSGVRLFRDVSCQSWVSSLAFPLRLTRRSLRPSCSGVLTPSCAPSYLTGLSAAARSDGCRLHHYRRANKAVAIHQSKKARRRVRRLRAVM
jgi:hypothetical protein